MLWYWGILHAFFAYIFFVEKPFWLIGSFHLWDGMNWWTSREMSQSTQANELRLPLSRVDRATHEALDTLKQQQVEGWESC